jgi:hypothetical protein
LDDDDEVLENKNSCTMAGGESTYLVMRGGNPGGMVEVIIPTSEKHWENIIKVVNLWLHPQSLSDKDIKEMIYLTRFHYGKNCARWWCDVLLHYENNGWNDKEIVKIIDYIPRFMNSSLKDSLKLADLYNFQLIYDKYFLLELSCKQILNRLEKRGVTINEAVNRPGIWIKWYGA